MTTQEYFRVRFLVRALPHKIGNRPIGITDEHILLYKGGQYYPLHLEADTTPERKVAYTAVLHDLRADSIVHCDLKEVTQKGE